ncbi:MAG: hypothetical protein ACYTEQ_20845 [Planctomycetota bacterium]|jgi:hypothetical protein
MDGKSAEERIGITETEIDNLKKSDDDQWKAINELRKYMQKLVPVWTAAILTVMGAITGSALTFAAMVLRYSEWK